MLFGGADSDILVSGSGRDHLNGGSGIDAASWQESAFGVVANLATGRATSGGVEDTFTQIENLIGSRFNDTLRGDGGRNELFGGEGNDCALRRRRQRPPVGRHRQRHAGRRRRHQQPQGRLGRRHRRLPRADERRRRRPPARLRARRRPAREPDRDRGRARLELRRPDRRRRSSATGSRVWAAPTRSTAARATTC